MIISFSGCPHFDHDLNQESASYNVAMLWYYGYLSLLTCQCDTIVLVARKRSEKVSKMHILNRTLAATSCWAYIRYTPGVDIMLMATSLLNLAEMSLYYFLVSLHTERTQYPWYRQHITTFQASMTTIFNWLHSLKDETIFRYYTVYCT